MDAVNVQIAGKCRRLNTFLARWERKGKRRQMHCPQIRRHVTEMCVLPWEGNLDLVRVQCLEDAVVQLMGHRRRLAYSRTNARTSNSSVLSPNFRNSTRVLAP